MRRGRSLEGLRFNHWNVLLYMTCYVFLVLLPAWYNSSTEDTKWGFTNPLSIWVISSFAFLQKSPSWNISSWCKFLEVVDDVFEKGVVFQHIMIESPCEAELNDFDRSIIWFSQYLVMPYWTEMNWKFWQGFQNIKELVVPLFLCSLKADMSNN